MAIHQSSATGVAGNVVSTITIGAGERRTILYGKVTLTTDGTVANRRVSLKILDAGDDVVLRSPAGAVVAASQTGQRHEFMPGIFRETSFIGASVQVPIPNNCIVPHNYKYTITIDNGVAGDSYAYNFIEETEGK